MLALRSLGFFVVLAAVGCASTSKNDDGSSGAGDSGSLGGNGGTGTGTTDASTSSNTSSSDSVGGNEINSGAGGGISTTSADSSSTGAGGQDDGNTNATTGDRSTAGVTSTNGAGGSTSGGATVTTGGAGGSGGAAFGCPDTPPSHGSECTASGLTCAYEDCDGIGRTVALCFASWEVEVAPCDEPVVCSGSFGAGECGADEVCLVSVSGAVSERCVENTCGDEAVECDCLVGCYGECSVSGDAEKGITMTCNTCLEDTCA